MSVLVANCPSCGGPVEFKSGQSIVVIYVYCRSAVARTDRDLKDLGKVAELVETGSPLDVGLRGKWKDVPFELTGRAQLGHEMGGQWDEWYATFSNGWLGWLAEAQGRFISRFSIRFRRRSGPRVRSASTRTNGQRPSMAHALIVAETGRATALGAKGEIPYLLTPGETYYYADLRHKQRVRHTRLQPVTAARLPGPTGHTRRDRNHNHARARTRRASRRRCAGKLSKLRRTARATRA